MMQEVRLLCKVLIRRVKIGLMARVVYADKACIPAAGVNGPNEVAELHNKELSTASAPSTHSGSGSSSRSDAEGGGLAPEAEPEASNACAAPASEQSEPQMRNFGGIWSTLSTGP